MRAQREPSPSFAWLVASAGHAMLAPCQSCPSPAARWRFLPGDGARTVCCSCPTTLPGAPGEPPRSALTQRNQQPTSTSAHRRRSGAPSGRVLGMVSPVPNKMICAVTLQWVAASMLRQPRWW